MDINKLGPTTFGCLSKLVICHTMYLGRKMVELVDQVSDICQFLLWNVNFSENIMTGHLQLPLDMNLIIK